MIDAQEPWVYLLGETIVFFPEEGAIPLYSHPPGENLREHIDNNKAWYQIGYEAAERDLKREPLSDDEIGKLCKDHFKVANLTSFVRAIEKHHGITGVDSE